MAVYLFGEGKYDQIFLPEILKQLHYTYCPLKNNDTKSLLLTDRNYYHDYDFILFSDNGRSDIYTKIMRRFCVSFFKKETVHPVRIILFLDDDYSSHEELTNTLLNHIRGFSYLIPKMDVELKKNENFISLSIPSDSIPRISIQVFYIPHSLERQIVLGGIPCLHKTNKASGILDIDPHQGLRELSFSLSCSVEDAIRKSVHEEWLIENSWYQNMIQVLKGTVEPREQI